jgi:hypothetical protein
MKNCTGAPAERFAMNYLEGTLPENEAEAFEEHYFDCPVCLTQVQMLQSVGDELGRQPAAQPELAQPRRVFAWPARVWALGALAALLVVSVVGYRIFENGRVRPGFANGGQTPLKFTLPAQPAPEKPREAAAAQPSTARVTASQLADLALPAFVAPNLRGSSDDSRFLEGMKAYSGGDCAGALTALARVPAAGPQALAARFYSGACQMHLGNLETAKADLRAVASAGDSPEQEAALYYLAQTALLGNDLPHARTWLDQTIALHGDFERRAKATLARINAPAGPR